MNEYTTYLKHLNNTIFDLNSLSNNDFKAFKDIPYYMINTIYYGKFLEQIGYYNLLKNLNRFFISNKEVLEIVELYNSKLSIVYSRINNINDGYFFYDLIGGSNTFNTTTIIKFLDSESIDEFITSFSDYYYDYIYDNITDESEYDFDLDTYLEILIPIVESIIEVNKVIDAIDKAFYYIIDEYNLDEYYFTYTVADYEYLDYEYMFY